MAGPLSRTALAENLNLADFQGSDFSYRKAFMSLFTGFKGRPASGGGTSMPLIANRDCLSQWPYCVWGMYVCGGRNGKNKKRKGESGTDFYL